MNSIIEACQGKNHFLLFVVDQSSTTRKKVIIFRKKTPPELKRLRLKFWRKQWSQVFWRKTSLKIESSYNESSFLAFLAYIDFKAGTGLIVSKPNTFCKWNVPFATFVIQVKAVVMETYDFWSRNVTNVGAFRHSRTIRNPEQGTESITCRLSCALKRVFILNLHGKNQVDVYGEPWVGIRKKCQNW